MSGNDHPEGVNPPEESLYFDAGEEAPEGPNGIKLRGHGFFTFDSRSPRGSSARVGRVDKMWAPILVRPVPMRVIQQKLGDPNMNGTGFDPRLPCHSVRNRRVL